MKRIFLAIFISIFVVSCEEPKTKESKADPKTFYNPNELIFVVEIDSNENKSIEDIAKFSQEYTDTIDENEPNTLGIRRSNCLDREISRWCRNDAARKKCLTRGTA